VPEQCAKAADDGVGGVDQRECEERQHEPGLQCIPQLARRGHGLGRRIGQGHLRRRRAEARQKEGEKRARHDHRHIEGDEGAGAERVEEEPQSAGADDIAHGRPGADDPEIGAVAPGHAHSGGIDDRCHQAIAGAAERPDQQDAPELGDEIQRQRRQCRENGKDDQRRPPVIGLVGHATDNDVEQ
jgi:hypothetical protein